MSPIATLPAKYTVKLHDNHTKQSAVFRNLPFKQYVRVVLLILLIHNDYDRVTS